ncbi:hypothetical protein HZC31_02475 [Candidatus Woesearchaeota archaeon]|nr:hypothetical protein [Candidatus Woesearchaeota archaeon]
MTLDILFLDKDETLGNWREEWLGLYPGVSDFLKNQKEKGRRLYIATTALNHREECLASVNTLLDGYFGRESIGEKRGELYVLPDGTFRKVDDDYQARIAFLSDEETSTGRHRAQERSARIEELLETGQDQSEEYQRLQQERRQETIHLFSVVHKQTREPFDETTRYVNPHTKTPVSHGKDLYLARRLIAPVGYETLRTVMVGDYGDETTVTSDPETPLIVVSRSVRAGDWDLVSRLTDTLFSDKAHFPWEVFDALYGQAEPQKDEKTIQIQGVSYKMIDTVQGIERKVRIIACP